MTRKAELTVDINCQLDAEYFEDWDLLTPEIKAFWDKHSSPHCEGSGNMGMWCEGCPFCKKFQAEVVE